MESGEKGILEDLAATKDESFPIGEYLARQRKVRGLSLEELEEITKIPVRSLERLEAGAFDRESDGFAGALGRAVAEALGRDAEDATMLMLAEPHVDSTRGAGISNPVRLGIAVALLLLLGSAIWLLRRPGVEEHLEIPVETASPVRRDAVRALAESVGLPSPEEGGEVGEGGPPH